MGASRVVECSWSYVRSEHATSATWGSMASRRPQGRPRWGVHVGRSSSIRGARSQALPRSLQSYYYCFLRIHTLGSLGTPSTEHQNADHVVSQSLTTISRTQRINKGFFIALHVVLVGAGSHAGSDTPIRHIRRTIVGMTSIITIYM